MTFKIGQVVRDDLTGKTVTIERINISTNGSVGLWVSSEYLDGGRHPWEVTTEEEMGELSKDLWTSTEVRADGALTAEILEDAAKYAIDSFGRVR
jgi:hypothetical protein